MKLAIDEAWKYQLLTYPNPAVGCVVVKDGKLLAIEAHKEAGMPHAEVNALKTALLSKESNSLLRALTKSSEIHDYLIKNHNNFFNDCEIYTTLEPCNHEGQTPSCAKLLSILKPKRVIIGSIDINKIANGGIKTLEDENINVTTKVLEKECENLLIPFKSWQNKTSIFFKMAQTLNGSIDGQISSQRAKLYVHTLRDKIDLLLIGGNTIRTDKPTLDTRYIKGREPDIFIYNLLDILKDKIDFFILIISPKIRNGVNALNELNIDFEILHENYLGDEKIVFLKRKV